MRLAVLCMVAMLSCVSCHTVKTGLAGQYVMKNRRSVLRQGGGNLFYIDLRKDSTYRMYFSSWHNNNISTGRWRSSPQQEWYRLRSYFDSVDCVPITVNEAHEERQGVAVVFERPKMEFTMEWTLYVNGKGHTLGGNNMTDSLNFGTGTKIKTIKVVGRVMPFAAKEKKKDGSWQESAHYIYPIQQNHDTIKSRVYETKSDMANVYRIAFPKYVDNDVMFHRMTDDSLKIKGNVLFFGNMKLRKSKKRIKDWPGGIM